MCVQSVCNLVRRTFMLFVKRSYYKPFLVVNAKYHFLFCLGIFNAAIMQMYVIFEDKC